MEIFPVMKYKDLKNNENRKSKRPLYQCRSYEAIRIPR